MESSISRLPEILTAAVQASGTLASVGPLLLPPGCGFRGTSQLLHVLRPSSLALLVPASSWWAGGCWFSGLLLSGWGDWVHDGVVMRVCHVLEPSLASHSLSFLPETSRSRAPEMDGGVEIFFFLSLTVSPVWELSWDLASHPTQVWTLSLLLWQYHSGDGYKQSAISLLF